MFKLNWFLWLEASFIVCLLFPYQCECICNYESYNLFNYAVTLPLVWSWRSCWAWQWCTVFPLWSQKTHQFPPSSYQAKTCGTGKLSFPVQGFPHFHAQYTPEEYLKKGTKRNIRPANVNEYHTHKATAKNIKYFRSVILGFVVSYINVLLIDLIT